MERAGVSGFKAWLGGQCHGEDPIGDLARDAHGDQEWPHGRVRLEARRCPLHDHLETFGAVPRAHPALERA